MNPPFFFISTSVSLCIKDLASQNVRTMDRMGSKVLEASEFVTRLVFCLSVTESFHYSLLINFVHAA